MADLRSLRLPLMVAPMFIASNLDLVLASCESGVIGAIPLANPRAPQSLDGWLGALRDAEDEARDAGRQFAPVCVNMSAKPGRDIEGRAAALHTMAKREVPMILTNNGDPRAVIDAAHEWGGKVFHDVTTLHHAEKAVGAGTDGLMLVCAGAGGHAGTLSPFAFLPRVRQFFDGPIILAGAIANGSGMAAALALGADLVVMGTRFLATAESNADERHKQMLIEANSEDIIYTNAISGLAASFLTPSVIDNGLDPLRLPTPLGLHRPDLPAGVKPWKTVWSAGHSTALVNDIPTVAELVDRLESEFKLARTTRDWRTTLHDPAAI
jgi:nitronate monooxygenase